MNSTLLVLLNKPFMLNLYILVDMLKASDFIMDDEPIINESVVKFGCFIACMVKTVVRYRY